MLGRSLQRLLGCCKIYDYFVTAFLPSLSAQSMKWQKIGNNVAKIEQRLQ